VRISICLIYCYFTLLSCKSNLVAEQKLGNESHPTIAKDVTSKVDDSGLNDRAKIIKEVNSIDTLVGSTGDTLILQLPAHFNTGYLWTLEEKKEELILAKKSQGRAKNDLQHFHFTTTQKGIYQLLFSYARPFEDDTSQDKSVKLYLKFN
jgi:predicted secreted protein